MEWRSNSKPEYNKGVSDSLGPTRCSGYFISAVERAVHFKQSDLEGWVCSGNFSLLVFWLFIYGDVLCLGGWKASLPSPSSLASILWKWTESVLPQGEELQLVREALRSLRDSFSGHDPQHHTLDTLEQGVASLMDRLHSLDNQRRQEKGVRAAAHAGSEMTFFLFCFVFSRCFPEVIV